MSLKVRILFTFLTVFATGLILLLVLQFTLTSEALLRVISERLHDSNGHLLALADAQLHHSIQLLEDLASREDVTGNVVVEDLDGVITSALRDLERTGLFVGSIDCADEDGRIISSSSLGRIHQARVSGEDWFRGARKGRIQLGEIEKVSPAGELGLALAFPIVEARSQEGTRPVLGVLRAHVRWSQLIELIAKYESEQRALGYPSERFRLVDRDCRILASTDPREMLAASLHTLYPGFPGCEPEDWPAPRILPSSSRTDQMVMIHPFDSPRTAVLGAMKGVSSIDVDEARAPVRNILMLSSLVGLIVALALGGLGVAGLERLVRPVPGYVAFAERVGRGELEGELIVSGDDELAALGRALDRMREGLLARTRELEERAQALARASRFKSEFLANMSHELRTPLNSVILLSKLQAENKHGNLNPRQIQAARMIHAAGADLLALISDILDLSKIEAGRMTVTLAATPLGELLDSLRSLFAPLCREKGLEFLVEATLPGDPAMITDRQKLMQILKNILSNAIKFTAKGRVGLSVRVDEPASTVTFTVEDTGIGIPPEKQRLIFDAFQQVDGTISRQFGGTGLGLSISQKLVEMLHGTIAVESSPGAGSRFAVTLPWSVMEVPASATVTAPRDAGVAGRESLRGKRVLIVDDDSRNLYSLGSLLEDEGLEICRATNGAEALETLHRGGRPDIIVMDVMMPVLDGLETTRRIRSDERHASIPIVALTALAQPSDREACLGAGADRFLSKPVDPESLVATLAELLAERA